MAGPSTVRRLESLGILERLAAGLVGLVLLLAAVLLVVNPPDRKVALDSCANAAVGCVVSVDNDTNAFGTAVAAFGAAAGLIALLGVRFTTLKAAGVELGGYERATAGLQRAEPQPSIEQETFTETADNEPLPAEDPVQIETLSGLGTELGTVPVAIARLRQRMSSTDPRYLRDYQGARKRSQRSYFLTHMLGPATSAGQKYSVAIRLSPHRDADDRVTSAQFYLGRAWGGRVFEGTRGADGRLGIVTEAYGPFLVLCEVEFADGDRMILDHYCDFEMGSLVVP